MSEAGAPGLWWDGSDAVPVDAHAIVRGGELAGPATLTVLHDRVMLVGESGAGAGPRRTGRLAALELPFDRLEGVTALPHCVSLYLGDGDLVELAPVEGAEERLARAAADLIARASRLPELTASLRTLGSRGAGAEHDEFFGPLLAARGAAERARDPLGRVAAVDATALRARLDDVVRAAAGRRAPRSPPERRALEAELGECVAPLAQALDDLAGLAAAVQTAADDVRLIRWREWAAGLARVFARADGCWESALPALARETRTSARKSVAARLWQSLRGER